MRLEYLLSGADVSAMRSACLSGFVDWIEDRTIGEGPDGPFRHRDVALIRDEVL